MFKKANRDDYCIIFSMWGSLKKQKSNIYIYNRQKNRWKRKGKDLNEMIQGV